MKKIGKQVLLLTTNETNLRNGESAMIRLKNGRIMHAYTEFYGADWLDHAPSRISAVFSDDEGESWSSPRVLIDKPQNAQNIMAPSLLRLADGGLGIVYGQKEVQADGCVTAMPLFSRSDDEGESFNDPIVCGMPLGYYCTINDGAFVTADGKIYLPMSYHGERYDAFHRMKEPPHHEGRVRLACSEDNGRTWHALAHIFETPFPDKVGFAEPGIYAHENGDLWMYCRTAYGHQYDSVSTDGGKTWSQALPNSRFTSPDAPMRVKKLDGVAVAVFNPDPFRCTTENTELWGSPKRTPLVISFSKKDGQDFHDRGRAIPDSSFDEFVKNTYYLENDPNNSFCYPAVLQTRDGFLVSYYYSNGSHICLNATKITKIYNEEL